MRTLAARSRRPDAEAPRCYDQAAMPALADPPNEDDRVSVKWSRFAVSIPWVASLSNRNDNSSGSSSSITPDMVDPEDAAQVVFEGYFEASSDGLYRISLATDTGVILRVHDATIVDGDFGYKSGDLVSGEVRLQAGTHPYRLHYRHEAGRLTQIDLEWERVGE